MKKVLLIIGILVLASVVGLYVYSSINKKGAGSAGGDTSSFKDFLPFGKGGQKNTGTTPTDNTTDGADKTTQDTENPVAEAPTKSKLTQITDFSVAGFTLLTDTRTKKDVTTSEETLEPVQAVRYVERANGHIHEQYLDTEVKGQISNSTIPSIYEALFGDAGKSVIFRYLSSDKKVIQSYIGTLGTTSGKFLPEDVQDVSISSDGSTYFYLAPLGGDVAGTTVSFVDGKKSQLFTSTFTEWLSDFGATNGLVFLTTKPSYKVAGSLYATSTKIGGLTKVFGGMEGLTTKTNHAGTKILFSKTTSYGIKTGIYDLTDRSFTDLQISTLPEKCVWTSNDANIYCAVPNSIEGIAYPDSWYQGLVSFSDTIYQIDTSKLSINQVYNTDDNGGMDVTNIKINETINKLFFTNKKDSTLWSYDLN